MLTISNAVAGAVTLIVFVLFLTRPKVGAFVYLGAVLLAPAASFGSITPRIELLLVPLGLLARLITERGFSRNPRISIWLMGFGFWLVWICFVTIISTDDIDWIGLYGFARFVGVSLLFFSIQWSEDDIVRAQWVFVLTVIPIALLTIGQLRGLGLAMGVTNAGYSPASAAVIVGQQDAMNVPGAVFRGVGVFGNVSPAGAYFVLVIGIALLLMSAHRWTLPQSTLLAISITLAFLGGFATLSGTFVGGATVIWIIALAAARSRARLRLVRRVVVWFGIFVALGTFAIVRDDALRAQIGYQFNRLASSDRLQGRYGSEGITDEAWRYVQGHPVAGAGVTKTSIFAGDSLYMTTLFLGGFSGVVIFVIPVAALLRIGWRGQLGSRFALVWNLGILLVGLSCAGMFVGRLGDWWWAMQGMLLSASFGRPSDSFADDVIGSLGRNRRYYMRASRVRPL